MSFVSWSFLALMVIVLLGRGAWSRRKQGWAYLGLLLLASMVFYGWHVPLYLGLILFSTTVDYFIARRLGSGSDGSRGRKWLLACSVVSNLGLLAVFKYANFALQFLALVLGHFGARWAPPPVNLILPMGLSFYTFVALSYTVDVYRRNLPAERNYLRLLLFVAFFPHLMAGPIIRASGFIYQMYRPRRVSWIVWTEGAWLVIQGYFLKMVCANNLALAVNRAWTAETIRGANSLSLLTLALLFSGQIFCDFAGYTAIARGIAYWLGFRFPINFNRPYLASSFRDFWRRWHITLSIWFRDYLYLPLGGNRVGRTSLNILITMLLAGLWHGAAWTFVVWGGLHGLALVAERRLGLEGGGPRVISRGNRLAWWLAVQAFVLLTWIVFRSRSLPEAAEFIGHLAGRWGGGVPAELWRPAVYLVPPVLLHLYGAWAEHRSAGPPAANAKALLAALMFLLILTAYGPNSTFLYFQF